MQFLLTRSGLNIDSDSPNYEVDFNIILNGIEKYKRDVHIIGRKVEVYYYRNIYVDDKCNIKIEIKEKEKPFLSFKDYYDRILVAMEFLSKNSWDKNRVKKYGIVTTVSRDYDSLCCDVIGKT